MFSQEEIEQASDSNGETGRLFKIELDDELLQIGHFSQVFFMKYEAESVALKIISLRHAINLKVLALIQSRLMKLKNMKHSNILEFQKIEISKSQCRILMKKQ